MTPEEILDVPALSLTQRQREHYLEQSYLMIEDALDQVSPRTTSRRGDWGSHEGVRIDNLKNRQSTQAW